MIEGAKECFVAERPARGVEAFLGGRRGMDFANKRQGAVEVSVPCYRPNRRCGGRGDCCSRSQKALSTILNFKSYVSMDANSPEPPMQSWTSSLKHIAKIRNKFTLLHPQDVIQPKLTAAELDNDWPAVRRDAASDAALKADAGSLANILSVLEEVGDKKLSWTERTSRRHESCK